MNHRFLTAGVATTVNTPTAAGAIESIAFDNPGNYYQRARKLLLNSGQRWDSLTGARIR